MKPDAVGDARAYAGQLRAEVAADVGPGNKLSPIDSDRRYRAKINRQYQGISG